MKALDKQIGGDHYKKYAIQPIEFISKNNLTYIQGNIIKYVMRANDKGGLQDLKKALHYIEIAIENDFKPTVIDYNIALDFCEKNKLDDNCKNIIMAVSLGKYKRSLMCVLDVMEVYEEYPVYDEAYLNRLIERGTKVWADIKDHNAWIRDMRGSDDE